MAIAHRGEPIGHRENTLSGIAAAVRAGADIVEIDAKTAADDVSVLLHDEDLQRLWGRPERVTTLASADLAALPGPDGGLPTLEQALALIAGTGTALLIDLDSPAWVPAALDAVERGVRDRWLQPIEALWCGRCDAMLQVRASRPDARIVLSWDEDTRAGALPDDDDLAALSSECLNPHWPMVTPEAVGWAHERGLALCCWTVDDAVTMTRMLDLGCDAMISNRIRLLRDLLDRRESRPA